MGTSVKINKYRNARILIWIVNKTDQKHYYITTYDIGCKHVQEIPSAAEPIFQFRTIANLNEPWSSAHRTHMSHCGKIYFDSCTRHTHTVNMCLLEILVLRPKVRSSGGLYRIASVRTSKQTIYSANSPDRRIAKTLPRNDSAHTIPHKTIVHVHDILSLSGRCCR